MEDLGQIDELITGSLGPPLLSDYFGSAIQRRDVLEIAEEIKRRHLAKLPRDTGNLASTAKITTPRVKHQYDSRFEAVYTIGGGRADYIVALEAQGHYLDEALREMGFSTPDHVSGPTGKIAPRRREPLVTVYHRTSSSSAADAIVQGGFRPTFREGTNPSYVRENSKYGFFTRDAGQEGYGSHVVKAQVPASFVEHDPYSGESRIKTEHLSGVRFERHVDNDASIAQAESEAGIRSGHVMNVQDEAQVIEDPRDAELQELAHDLRRRKRDSAPGAQSYWKLQDALGRYRRDTGQGHAEAEGTALLYRERRRAAGLSPQPDVPRGPNHVEGDPNAYQADWQNPNVPPRRG